MQYHLKVLQLVASNILHPKTLPKPENNKSKLLNLLLDKTSRTSSVEWYYFANKQLLDLLVREELDKHADGLYRKYDYFEGMRC